MDLTKRLLATLGLVPACDLLKGRSCLTYADTTTYVPTVEDSEPASETGTVGPCLAPKAPTGDTGEEPLVTGDTGVDTADTADTGAPTAARVRQEVLGSGRLPADVIERLRRR